MATDLQFEQLHRIGVDDYHQLIKTGWFGEKARVELIDGLLVDMTPKTLEHDRAIMWLTRWLVTAVDGKRFDVGVGCALTLERSEPEPDFFVVRKNTPRPYHPGTAELVIEVSVSSLRHDLIIKHGVYAAAGVHEYWVVDLDDRRVVRHREPDADHYRDVDELREGDTLVASALELPALDLGELFAAAFD